MIEHESPDPVSAVGDEARALAEFKLVKRNEQAQVSFGDQVRNIDRVIPVAKRDGHNVAQVGLQDDALECRRFCALPFAK